jgi:uncharacterized protein
MKKAIIYLVTFVALQLFVALLVKLGFMLFGNSKAVMDTTTLIITQASVSVLTIVVFLWTKWGVVSRDYLLSKPYFTLFWCVLASLGAIIPSTWIQEQMPALPNILEQQFDMILKDRMGYLVIGLLAPFAEELVFRGAILKALLGWSKNHWYAIAISALVFALVHGNPAQMPHAFVIGLLLGWMYYRTDSIIPSVAFHWVNNTAAYILYNIMPNPNAKLIEVFNGNSKAVLLSIVFSLFILVPSIYQLNMRLKKAK